MKIKTTNLDRLFSQYIRTKAGFICKACGVQKDKNHTDCAHIFGRRSRSTRWLEDNAVCLCKACHFYYTERPHDWNDITLEWLGEKRLGEVRLLFNTGVGPKDAEKEKIGLDLIDKIKAMGEQPVCGIGKRKS